jgi:phosphonatase-like hydrolase
MPLQLVIFDLSGTTIEDAGQVPGAFSETMQAHGYTLSSEFMQSVRGASKFEIIRRVVEMQRPDRLATVDQLYLEFRERLRARYRRHSAQTFPDTSEVFKFLRAKDIKIALNTGFDRLITDSLMASAGFDHQLVETVICSDDVQHGRPAPDMILRAMELTNVQNPGCVANVGDTINDLIAGHAAKVRWNIGVCSGAHTRKQLQTAPHTHILSGIAEVPSVLG